MSSHPWSDRFPDGVGLRVRGMLAVEALRTADPGVKALLAAVGDRHAQVTVTSAPRRDPPYWRFAATGGFDCSALRAQALLDACHTARRTIELFPNHVAVDHRAARSWGDLLEMLHEEQYDFLYVAGAPASWRDRRTLLQASRRASAEIVVVAS